MKKYPIDKDFEMLSKFTVPFDKNLFGISNFFLELMSKKMKFDKSLNIEKRKIKSYDGEEIDVYIMEPKGCKEILPCLVFLHGGGFAFKGSWNQYELARKFALEVPCKVVFVDYRVAPKNPFPTPMEDCYFAFQYALENCEQSGIDASKIAVYGDSAGGNLAASLCFLLRDRLHISPCFQMLVYPVIDRRQQTNSMKKYSDTPIWNSKLNDKMWKYYLGDKLISHIEYVSPIEAENFEEIPDAYIETAEFDCLHDEGVQYAETLKSHGCNVELNQTNGTIHGFDMDLKSEITKKWIKHRVDVLKEIFKE